MDGWGMDGGVSEWMDGWSGVSEWMDGWRWMEG